MKGATVCHIVIGLCVNSLIKFLRCLTKQWARCQAWIGWGLGVEFGWVFGWLGFRVVRTLSLPVCNKSDWFLPMPPELGWDRQRFQKLDYNSRTVSPVIPNRISDCRNFPLYNFVRSLGTKLLVVPGTRSPCRSRYWAGLRWPLQMVYWPGLRRMERSSSHCSKEKGVWRSHVSWYPTVERAIFLMCITLGSILCQCKVDQRLWEIRLRLSSDSFPSASSIKESVVYMWIYSRLYCQWKTNLFQQKSCLNDLIYVCQGEEVKVHSCVVAVRMIKLLGWKSLFSGSDGCLELS